MKHLDEMVMIKDAIDSGTVKVKKTYAIRLEVTLDGETFERLAKEAETKEINFSDYVGIKLKESVQ